MKRIALFTLAWAIVAISVLTAVSHGQGTTAASKAVTPKPKAPGPVTMTECEGVNNCATWTFLGTQGNGQWPSGDIANLTVDTSDTSSVVIHRADSTGASAGLTATYTGTRHGGNVGGEFTSSWPGHWDKKEGNWYATIVQPLTPPPVIQECDVNHTCGTWTWNNGHYDGVWVGVNATLTVVSFTPQSVVIKRADLPPRVGFNYTFTGTISAQGDTILDGIWTGDPGSRQAGVSGTFTASWGAALQNAAQAPQPPPVVVVRPTVCYPWFFGMVCE